MSAEAFGAEIEGGCQPCNCLPNCTILVSRSRVHSLKPPRLRPRLRANKLTLLCVLGPQVWRSAALLRRRRVMKCIVPMNMLQPKIQGRRVLNKADW